jgi:glycosyltransferase involved in cell wall biosynthesis
MRRRIVQIVGDGRPGGGTTVVLTLARMLKADGHEIAIISQTDSVLIREAAAGGFSVRNVDFSRRGATLATARSIGAHLRDLGADIVHAHGARAGLPAALVAPRRGRKFVYSVHGFHFRSKPPVLRELACAAEGLIMARAACTIFVSDADRRIAERYRLTALARSTRVIKNAVVVDTGLFSAAKTYDIGFLGRLHHQKNPLILVDILKALRPLRPSLCVIGGGELEAELRTRLTTEGFADQASMQGERNRDQALRLLSSCRVLLLPSRWEGHPLAPIEAMHLGLPVVASDIPGTNEIVVEGETGFLVASDDAQRYADRLRMLLSDGALHSRMGQTARECAMREYAPEPMAAAHRAVYGLGE